MGDFRLLSCQHCKQQFLSDNAEQCDLCGKKGGMIDVTNPNAGEQDINADVRKMLNPDPLSIENLRATKMHEPGPTPSALGQVAYGIRSLKMGCAGVFVIGVGIALLTLPIFRANPKELTLNEAAPGIGALVVGALLLAIVVLPAVLGNSRPSSPDRDRDGSQSP